jgi:tol-pal system protein YbgF
MKLIRQSLIAAVFCCLLPTQSFSVAPVVDDSENFAILDDQQADMNQPVAHEQSNSARFNDNAANDDKPLAHDDPTSKKQPVEVLDKVQGMQQEIQELRGQLEVQSHELKLLKDQQLSFYKDLDDRLRQSPATIKNTTANSLSKAEISLNQPSSATGHIIPAPVPTIKSDSAATSNNVTVTPPTTGKVNPADEQLSYMAAYELVRNKQFENAIPAMQAFLTKYPHGGYTANAQYWLGELFMVKKNYPEAIEHFDIVLTQYPNSSKAAASLLKEGYALAASGKSNEAKQKLNQVLKQYPDTSTAQLAASKLKSLSTM